MFCKRYLLSSDDALFVSSFLSLLIKNRTYGIHLVDLGTKIFEHLAVSVKSCTEAEARVIWDQSGTG